MNPQIVYTDGKERFITELVDAEDMNDRMEEILQDRFTIVCILF